MLRLIVLTALGAMAAFAAQPKIELSSISPSLQFGDHCAVQFNEIEVALSSSPLPAFSEVSLTSRWFVTMLFQNGSAISSQVAPVTTVKSLQFLGKDQYPITGQILLGLAEPVNALPLRIFVSLDLLGGAVAEWQPKENVRKFVSACTGGGPQTPGQTATPSPTPASSSTKTPKLCDYSKLGFNKVSPDAKKQDVSLNGALTAGFGAHPVYTIAATIDLPVCPTENYDFDIGGTINTAQEPKLDPDSFTSYLSAKPRSPSRYGDSIHWYRTWEVRGGGEFSRKDQFVNIVFSPKYSTGYSNFKVNSQGHVAYSGGFEVTASVEVGDNLRTKAFRAGYGAIGRLAPSATAYFLIPLRSPTRSFAVTSTYNPRVLLSEEPFTDNRILVAPNQPFKSFARGTRQYWLNEVDIDLTDLTSLTFKTEFGSLPPAFSIVDYRFTTGLTIKWNWTKPPTS